MELLIFDNSNTGQIKYSDDSVCGPVMYKKIESLIPVVKHGIL